MSEKKASERRTLNVSNWVYGIVEYGARVYHVSKTDFQNKVFESFLKRDRIDFKIIIDGLSKKEGNDSGKMENKANDSVSEMSNSELLRYGLRLMEDINPEKAKELRERLKNLNLTVFSNLEQMTAVSSQT